MPTVEVKGEPIFYSERSTGQTRHNLVMIHGAGGTHRTWLPQVNSLDNCRAIALDLPGHGRSGGQGRDSIPTYADFILNFLQALHVERAVLAGHSMGGGIVLELALRQAPQIAGLILVGTGARLRVRPEFLTGLQENVEETIKTLVTWFYGSAVGVEMLRQGELELRASLPGVFFGDFLACDRFDVMQRLGEIRLPTLVICGEEDQLTLRKYSEYLRDHIPGAHLVVVPQAGHMVMVEQPAVTAQAIDEFLATI